MTEKINDNENNHNRDNENRNDIYFRYKLEKIKCQYDQFWKQPSAQDDVDAYLRKDHDHEYWKDEENGDKWIKGTNNFQEKCLRDKKEIFAENDKALIVRNVYSFDVQQNPEKAGMSFIHLLGVPKDQIFNGVSLTPDNCDIIDDIINLFEENWGNEEANCKFRDCVVEHEKEKINKNEKTQIEDIQKTFEESDHSQHQEEVRDAGVKRAIERAAEARNRCHELESHARELKVADFSYGLHLWPEQSVPHLHVHIIAHPPSMRLYSTKDHDEKTVNAKEVRRFIRSERVLSDSSETLVPNGGETNNSTINRDQHKPEPNETSTDSIVREMSGMDISDTKA